MSGTNIYVDLGDGRRTTVEVSPNAETLDVLGELQKQGIDTGFYIITFQGEEIKGSKLLADVGIGSETTICLKKYTVTDVILEDCGDPYLHNTCSDESKKISQLIDKREPTNFFTFYTSSMFTGCCSQCLDEGRFESMITNARYLQSLSVFQHSLKVSNVDPSPGDRVCSNCHVFFTMLGRSSTWYFPDY